ncbi:MAG: histidinol phosphate phosphatase domain-containing protein [Candidatus Omnitrophica bacterium]|nr:histidinol phosphate phosphatase domain-containing protein [Candidatus Omnitrophota bacterium]MDD5653361.1 histidinol phosphate phosphatase domain-containing protein [Candidatus Omnitrophota bacterium]
MYNLHCHSLLSDGVLLPSEIAVRFAALGYKAIAITDHADYSNIQAVVRGVLEFTRNWPKTANLKVLSGVELTHLPLEQFKPLAKYARRQGIKIIIGHGETPAEPIVKGTNHAALEADIDILAHPGLITDADVFLAKEKNIFLEITARSGHKDTNNHVVAQAKKHGANLILDLDSHAPEDIISPEELKAVGLAAGLSAQEIIQINQKIEGLLKRKGAG